MTQVTQTQITTSAPKENTMTNTPELVMADANSVIIEDNIRTEETPDARFLSTVETYGILTPVHGRRDSEGRIHIRAGQRRTLAARATGVPLPVIIFNVEDAEPEWARTATQVIENDHRKNITALQRAAAYRQMELDGLTVPKIAKQLGVSKTTVQAGIVVAKATSTAELFHDTSLDLIQMATIAEFDGDEETVASLIETALNYPHQLDHSVERARRNKAEMEAITKRLNELREQGKTAIAYDQAHEMNAQRLSQLDKDEEATVDPDPDLGDGLVIVVTTNYQGEVHEWEAIIDPELHGYKAKYSTSASSNTGPMTDEQKTERRQLIANNKAWAASESVRQAWLAEFLTRKSFPKDASAFIAVSLTRFPYEMERGNQTLVHALLGVEPRHGIDKSALADMVEANPSKAGVVTLALVLAKYEDSLSKETWRAAANGSTVAPSKHFFLQLREWGYNLSRIESVVIGEGSVDPDTDN